MKKVLMLMAAMMVVTFSAQAQKKGAQDAEKAKKEMQMAAVMDRIIPAKNFQFVPTEYSTPNGGRNNINQYRYTKIRPNSLEANMPLCPSINTNTYEWISCEKKKDIWNVKIKATANGGATVNFNFAVNAKTGATTLRLSSNRSLEGGNMGSNSATFKGEIREY